MKRPGDAVSLLEGREDGLGDDLFPLNDSKKK